MELATHDRFGNRGRSLVMVVMDGIGVAPDAEDNAVTRAYTPVLDRLHQSCPGTILQAHGTAVGLPSNADMGNSEVGHNALGAGRIFDQGAKLVNEALADGSLFAGPLWGELTGRAAAGGTLHFLGLLSDGNVHSHIDQLLAMIRRAAADGVPRLRVHALLDGRDVPETSSPLYIARLERVLAEIRSSGNRDYRIASGGGRMVITMDRYEADWGMVERGWETHVRGEGRGFPDAATAVATLREESGAGDQFLPPFVVHDEEGRPVGPIVDGDGVIFFNFRGDRAIEISRAFEAETLPHFDRGALPKVLYAGMMQYDGDTATPARFLVPPPRIDRTLGAYMAGTGLAQLAAAETQKYGHVTYFWNGNRSGRFDESLETYLEIPSDQVPFEERPWMQAAQVTDAVLAEMDRRRYDFVRLNYANGDMVGHTGHLAATRTAVAAVDLGLERIVRRVERTGAILVVTADHGNADQMFQRAKDGSFLLDPTSEKPQPLTAHTLNPVPFLVHDPVRPAGTYSLAATGGGLGNVAATLLDLMGYAAPEGYLPTLLA